MKKKNDIAVVVEGKPIDWTECEILYIKGDNRFPNGYPVKELVKRYDVQKSCIYQKIKDEGWDEAKNNIVVSGQQYALELMEKKNLENIEKRVTQIDRLENAIIEKTTEALENLSVDDNVGLVKLLGAVKGATGAIKDLTEIVNVKRGKPISIQEKRITGLPDNWQELPASELDRIVEEYKQNNMISVKAEIVE